MKPFVSVIIPTLNENIRLEKCLKALSEQTYGNENFEVIVVDNGSEKFPSEIKNININSSIYLERKEGSYAARNLGISKAKGKVLAFTDADCVPDPIWLEKGVESLGCIGNVGAIGGKIAFSFQSLGKLKIVELYDSLIEFDQKKFVEKMNFAATANLITYRSIFDSIGLFDEKLKSGGDNEWGNRVVKKGYPIVFCDEAIVRHPARSSLHKLIQKNMRVVGGGVNIYKKREGGIKKIFMEQLKDILLIGQTRKALFEWNLPFRKLIPVLLLMRLIGFVRVYERFRVLLGGKPRRV